MDVTCDTKFIKKNYCGNVQDLIVLNAKYLNVVIDKMSTIEAFIWLMEINLLKKNDDM